MEGYGHSRERSYPITIAAGLFWRTSFISLPLKSGDRVNVGDQRNHGAALSGRVRGVLRTGGR